MQCLETLGQLNHLKKTQLLCSKSKSIQPNMIDSCSNNQTSNFEFERTPPAEQTTVGFRKPFFTKKKKLLFTTAIIGYDYDREPPTKSADVKSEALSTSSQYNLSLLTRQQLHTSRRRDWVDEGPSRTRQRLDLSLRA